MQVVHEIRSLVRELEQRKQEALDLYEPVSSQIDFFKSKARVNLFVAANRAGKTLAAAVSVAMALTGRHPRLPKEDGRAFAIAKDSKEVGDVLYRKLFKPGAFKIVQHLPTGRWEAYKPWLHRANPEYSRSKPAPPLVPARFVKDIAWESRKAQVPALVVMHNGWTLRFLSSKGDPVHGVDLDLCLAGWSEIYDPVAGKRRRVDEITEPFHVFGLGPTGIGVYKASRPFIKGYAELCRVTLSDGNELFTTREHRVMTVDRQFVSVQEAWLKKQPLLPSSSVDCDVSGACTEWCKSLPAWMQPLGQFGQQAAVSTLVRPDIGTSPSQDFVAAHAESVLVAQTQEKSPATSPTESCRSYTSQGFAHRSSDESPSRTTPQSCDASYVDSLSIAIDSLGHCFVWNRPHDERPLMEGEIGPTSPPSQDGVLGRTPANWRMDEVGETAECSQFCPPSVQRGVALQDFSEEAHNAALTRQPMSGREMLLSSNTQERQRSPQSSCLPHTNWQPLQGQSDKAEQVFSSSSSSPIYVNKIEVVGEGFIWDISVDEVHNYVHESIISSNCWIDEELVNTEWYSECSARLIDREGFLIWSATPQAGTAKLYELYEEAMRQADEEPNPHIEAFVMTIDDNPYLPDKAKADFKSGLLDDDDVLVRAKGQFAILGLRVFPNWGILSEIMAQPLMEIPPEWTRYAVIDPGRQVCAVLFGAVPPPEFGDYLYLYDELYIKNCTADILAGEMKVKVRDQDIYDFIIDRQGSRVKQTGDGVELEVLYSQAFQRHGVRSTVSGHGFTPSIPHKNAGIEAIRELMRVRPEGKEAGTTKLRYFPDRLKNLDWEARHWNHKRHTSGPLAGKPTEEAEDRGRVHLMAALRYMSLYRPQYVRPEPGQGPRGLSYRLFLEKMQRRYELMGTGRINLGPGERVISVG